MRKFIVFSLCFLLFCFSWALAEKDEIYVTDFSNDLRSYCEQVALLTKTNDRKTGLLQGKQDDIATEPCILICRFSGDAPEWEKAPVSPVSIIYGPYGFCTLSVPEKEKDQLLEWLKDQPGMLFAEADQTVSGSADRLGEEIQSFHSWAAASMSIGNYCAYSSAWGKGSATIAVIDSGVYMHNLIRPKVKKYGFDYVDADTDPTNDLNGHGTHVAGIIADCTENLPVYIYPIRVLDASASGKLSNVTNAVLEAKEAGVHIINLSLSTFNTSEALESAIRLALSSGTAVVVAAGNDSCNTAEVTPAKMTDSGVIVVGSAEKGTDVHTRSSYSNYGDSVDVYAYGSNVASCSRSGGYVSESGTSMAAPHISALCAMMRLIHPGLSPGGMERRLKAAAGSDSINVPDALAMIPESMGCRLSAISINMEDRLELPLSAIPESCMEPITWDVENPAVVYISEEGVLVPKTSGSTQMVASCTGFDTGPVTVTVSGENGGRIVLPDSVEEIESESFAGCENLRIVELPFTSKNIAGDAFPQKVLFLCKIGSSASVWAQNNPVQYLLIK